MIFANSALASGSLLRCFPRNLLSPNSLNGSLHCCQENRGPSVCQLTQHQSRGSGVSSRWRSSGPSAAWPQRTPQALVLGTCAHPPPELFEGKVDAQAQIQPQHCPPVTASTLALLSALQASQSGDEVLGQEQQLYSESRQTEQMGDSCPGEPPLYEWKSVLPLRSEPGERALLYSSGSRPRSFTKGAEPAQETELRVSAKGADLRWSQDCSSLLHTCTVKSRWLVANRLDCPCWPSPCRLALSRCPHVGSLTRQLHGRFSRPRTHLTCLYRGCSS